MSGPALTIGLTGGIGSGKSAVSTRFASHGIAIVDTDAISRELTAPGGAAIPALRATFGEALIAADGSMDRASMRARVFADPAERLRLEALLHPLIEAEAIQRCNAATSPYVIVDVPLLTETGRWRARSDRICVVDCPQEQQIARVMQRSGLSADAVKAIIATQASREARLAIADDVVDNSGTLAALHARVDALHKQYQNLVDVS